MHPEMSADLPAALGAIQWGVEEQLEVLKEKKQKDEEMKPVLGHIEYEEEEDDGSKVEKHELEDEEEDKILRK